VLMLDETWGGSVGFINISGSPYSLQFSQSLPAVLAILRWTQAVRFLLLARDHVAHLGRAVLAEDGPTMDPHILPLCRLG